MRVRSVPRSSLIAIAGAIVAVGLVGCGETQQQAPAAASPQSADVADEPPQPPSAPATAVGGLTVADFDSARFLNNVAQNPPDTVRMTTEMPAPTGAGSQRVDVALRTADEASRVVFEIESEATRIVIEMVTIGDRVYLRGEGPGGDLDWITATRPDSGEALGLEDAAALGPMELELTQAWEAVAVAACPDGRTCFVLETPEDPSAQLYVDSESYFPRKIVSVDAAGGMIAEVSIEWNVDIDISPPADGREVPAEELMIAFGGLLMAGAGADALSIPTAPAAGT